MNYVENLNKIMTDSKLYVLWRGYSGEILPSGAVKFGDALFASKQDFRECINTMCAKRYEALYQSIERTEKLFE